ncbi:MAG: hypothetical protein SFT94_05590 [Pseudanabaenaceae cyanobacterium bins.68]|nr:hypothetical protein [Pseudanabaenaceae cyanobacterium bins.68]
MATLDLNAKFTAPDANENDSRKYMKYTSDFGVEYAVLISENIGETFDFEDIDAANTPALPQGFEMRRVYAVDASGKVRASYPVGNPASDVYREGGTVVAPRKGKADGLLLRFTGSVGEKKRFVSSDDTGQNSGDNT